jgi:hypothetical protein
MDHLINLRLDNLEQQTYRILELLSRLHAKFDNHIQEQQQAIKHNSPQQRSDPASSSIHGGKADRGNADH